MSKCKLLYCDGTEPSHTLQWYNLVYNYIESCSAEYQKNPNPDYSAHRIEEDLSIDDLFIECKESFDDMACSPYESKTDLASKWLDYIFTFSDEIIGDLYFVTYVLKPKNRRFLSIIQEEMPTFPITEKDNLIYIKETDYIQYIRDNHDHEQKTQKRNKKETLCDPRNKKSHRKKEHNPDIVENKLHMYKVIESTNIYDDAIKYASSGTFNTEETITFKYLRDVYTMTFDFSFSYDESNGITSDEISPKLLIKERSVIDFEKLEDLYLVNLIEYLIADFLRKV